MLLPQVRNPLLLESLQFFLGAQEVDDFVADRLIFDLAGREHVGQVLTCQIIEVGVHEDTARVQPLGAPTTQMP